MCNVRSLCGQTQDGTSSQQNERSPDATFRTKKGEATIFLQWETCCKLVLHFYLCEEMKNEVIGSNYDVVAKQECLLHAQVS